MTMTMPWKAPDETHADGVASKLDEMRRALSQEAEHLAQAAAQYGHDASAHVSTIAHDPVASANSWTQQLMKAAATLGAALALSSRQTAKDLRVGAQAAAKEARTVRLTTETRKTGPDLVPGITLLAGFGAGLALMYFLDPERGRQRRQLLRDRLLAWTRRSPVAVSETGVQQMSLEETQAWDTSPRIGDEYGEVYATGEVGNGAEQPEPMPSTI